MQKPTRQQIETEPAGSRIDKWFSTFVMNKPPGGKYGMQKSYSTNIAHAMEGEKEISKLSERAWSKYIMCLIYIVEHDSGIWRDREWWLHRGYAETIFPLVHATAHQRTRALLLWAL